MADYLNLMYKNLAMAIVKQAADDYKKAIKMLQLNPNNKEFKSSKREIEHFFNSAWFDTLCDLDGKKLAHDIREMVKGE